MKTKMVLLRVACRWALRSIACLTLFTAGSGIAAAQEIEPNEFVALPAGTNLLLGYQFYQHDTTFNFASGSPLTSGSTIKNSGLEINASLFRYVHFTTLFGQ